MKNKENLGRFIFYILLFIVTLTMLVPIVNLLALSLTDPARVKEVTGLTIIPKGFSFDNYRVLFSNPQIMKSLFNSVFITVIGTALNLALTIMAAYALTRPGLVGKKFFMVILIIVMVFEPGLIPEYLLIKSIGLLDTYSSVILYKALNVYYLIILMRFFEEVPEALIDAARVDGAGHLTVLFKILIPLSKSSIATIGLFYGVFHWNEYFRASIYLNDSAKWPLQLVLRQFVVLNDTTSMLGANSLLSFDKASQLSYKALQAGTIMIAIVPILLIYPFILKNYTKGTMEGGVKE
ncbi:MULTISPECIES: carbohydrate ABC transporter permease [Clostridium]|uniref:carbohydrate ABC transporter permease n=1 Tax=Clostridium TaxID=1485 RepID=UPI0013E948EE|nr:MULTISPECIES: carbohydrate ABC transporter permease [Clostridium]MBW9158419.1 carbohydrate ABC transporter permease [Clostridium tagluense]MBZ9634166.1 carbohydrate ABC transporter permease [Clostridium sp. FP1]MCB2296311.1 carbohydrate ABC transporter permease [Clostridium tagluense]WLC66901.1 carbohydrate ABC transporter permease [Clostridium tagluense]